MCSDTKFQSRLVRVSVGSKALKSSLYIIGSVYTYNTCIDMSIQSRLLNSVAFLQLCGTFATGFLSDLCNSVTQFLFQICYLFMLLPLLLFEWCLTVHVVALSGQTLRDPRPQMVGHVLDKKIFTIK